MKSAVAAIAMFIIIGCGAHTPRRSEPEIISGSADGEKIYRRQCRNCHSLPKPKSHADDEWPGILGRHSTRVSLTEEQVGALLSYLTEHN